MSSGSIFTVGHSNKTLDHFLSLLSAQRIGRVRDIRTVPESAYVPHFGKSALRLRLQQQGIEYHWDGDALGGHPKERRLYRPDGRVDFARLEGETEFQAAMKELERTAPEPRTALLCKEGDPLACPRFFLVGRLLSERGVAVFHILQDGRVLTHRECEEEMLRNTGEATPDLFNAPEAQLRKAYQVLMDRYDHRWPAG